MLNVSPLFKYYWKGGNMRRAMFLLFIVSFLRCSDFSSNSVDPRASGSVYIQHVGTEYVETLPPGQGLVATKVNVLSFEIRAENCQPNALEFYGRAAIQGPPGNREHGFCFRTDSLSINTEIAGYNFNVEQRINHGTTYTLMRPKYPTNEYAPFEGIQGKVMEVTITEAWAIYENGDQYSVAVRE